MPWHGHLALNYRLAGPRTVVHDRHRGPLRILQSLYPEGDAVCHNVLVHPPGGIVGGDVLHIEAALGESTHAVITTPGATRFYRSAGATAEQTLTARMAAGARLEWLPAETICHRAALADSRLRFELAPGAEMIGSDVLALGLPASGEPFDAGRYTQQIELPGIWLERGRVAAADTRLLDSPLGLAGHRVLGTLWFAAGSALDAARRDALVDAARVVVAGHALAATTGVTSAQRELVVLRLLAHRVEPAMALLRAVRAAWRTLGWGLAANPPRIWQT